MIKLEDLLKVMVREGASDLILKTGGLPAIRSGGRVRFISDTPISSEFTKKYVEALVGKARWEDFMHNGSLDRALSIDGIGRFRCNIFRQAGQLALVFRHVKKDIPGFKDLSLPVDPLKRLCELRRGLILATGVAGSGKSTTLASMLNYINANDPRHIITIEDPIEFQYEDKCSIVSQREIGTDAPTFAAALRQALRQAPDVILIGEMRDRETVEAAINAAETGHLVFSTLHTVNAVQTVERIIAFFEPHQHALIRLQLALNLAGVVSLRLIRLLNDSGQLPAVELLVNTPTVRDYLNEGRTRELPKALAEGSYYGTMTFNQSLIRLYEAGNISYEDALANSDNPEELKLQMRGISRGSVKLTV
ncbi:MAG: PilT/PilU family type 4a pilus ATPase [Planctomycetes bacterium]|nr:PilT/PilU family type 4a pilus ATPase [Planctomycetota bacterium]MCB9890721.1 PilT/PilU family type 4a pilus ATPase [Planctomycetota bacterium]MCB9920056.1 PilT/PilU family type 4a pilus ATPase [Planctomycetota bacterium]